MSDSDLKSTTATLETSPEEIEKIPASERRRMTLNMGPQHPSTHGVLRVLLELDGETVITRRIPTSASCTPASKNSARRRTGSRSCRSPIASITWPT